MTHSPVQVEVRQDDLRDLIRVIREQEDGRALRKELAKSLRDTLKPHADRAKNAALSIPSGGGATSPPLRPAIAKAVQQRVNMSLRGAGASVRAKRTPRIREFASAPKHTNSIKGWRTQSWGTDVWRVQMGKPNWFDDAMEGTAPEARAAIKEILDDMAKRIASRVG